MFSFGKKMFMLEEIEKIKEFLKNPYVSNPITYRGELVEMIEFAHSDLQNALKIESYGHNLYLPNTAIFQIDIGRIQFRTMFAGFFSMWLRTDLFRASFITLGAQHRGLFNIQASIDRARGDVRFQIADADDTIDRKLNWEIIPYDILPDAKIGLLTKATKQ